MSDILNKIDTFIEYEHPLSDEHEPDDIMESMLDFLSLIDFDELNEEQIEALDKVLDQAEKDELNEKTKRVVRGGKLMRKKVCKSGYKAVGGECVKITAQEKRARKKGAKKAARKKKSQGAAIARARKKSMKKSKLVK